MEGCARFGEMVHQGGVTVTDMGTGLITTVKLEAALIRQALGSPDLPFRVMLTPIETGYIQEGIDAAWILGMENEIGAIRTGKKADFTVLTDDPYEVGVAGLADMRPRGTVFEGQIAPIVAQ